MLRHVLLGWHVHLIMLKVLLYDSWHPPVEETVHRKCTYDIKSCIIYVISVSIQCHMRLDIF